VKRRLRATLSRKGERVVIIKKTALSLWALWERGDRAAVGEGVRPPQDVTVFLKYRDLAGRR
jgi:hypothetical protein